MSPRVLIDATGVPSDRGGVGRYVDGLLPALATAGADLAIACQRSDGERFARLVPTATVCPAPYAVAHRAQRLVWEQDTLPRLAEEVGAEVVHCPYYSLPETSPVPVVVTVHDATVFSDPDIHQDERGEYRRSATRSALEKASRLVVPSRATRDELVRLLHAEPDRVDVAYHGLDAGIFHPPSAADRERVAARLGLRGSGYVGFLGELSRRKNLAELVHGWAMTAADLEDPPALVLAGPSTRDRAIDEVIAQVPTRLRVIRPGFLRREDLPGFLGGAMVMAFPSRAEGFGFPTLEAMACGAAVLVARALSLPEVGGTATAYTEPDAAAIAENLSRLLADPVRRTELSQAAIARSAQFTWTRSATEHLACYTRAAADGR